MISLEVLLSKKESSNIEFKKSSTKLSKDIWETYSAFANTNGGYIVLGIEEASPHTFTAIGVSNPQKMIDDLYNTAANKDKVSKNLLNNKSVVEQKYGDKTVIIIEIEELPINQKPLYLNKNLSQTYIRKNSGDYLASSEEISRFMRNASDNIDAELLENYTINDLDKESILIFKELVNIRKPDENFLEMDPFTFLEKMGVFRIDRTDNRKYKLTLAGLIFLGTEEAIASRLPHFHLDFLNKKGNPDRWIDRVSSNDLNYPNLNVLKYYRIVRDKLFATIDDPFELDENTVRKSKAELHIVLREALVNMLIHADYLDKDHPIRCEVHDLYYVFANPGTMKIPKDLFFVGNYSNPRNDILLSFFKKIGAAEREGGGGRTIYDFTLKNNFREPELDVDLQKTKLKIWTAFPKEAYTEFSQEVQNVLLYIRNNGYARMKEIEKNTGLTNYSVRKAIKQLLEKDLIIIKGQGKATIYVWKHSKIENIATLDKMKSLLIKGN